MKYLGSVFLHCLTAGAFFALSVLADAQTQTSAATTFGDSSQQNAPKAFDSKEPSPQSFSNTVAFTNSMEVLNDQTRLGNGDTLSYRVVEERTPPIAMTVTDSGEMEVPFIGRVKAAGKTCKQIAYEIKPLLEKEYFYKATVIVGLSTLSTRSRGKVYLMGQVRTQGAMDLPADEVLTVSKVILRAGGLADFANRKKVKLVRKNRTETKRRLPSWTLRMSWTAAMWKKIPSSSQTI